MRFVILLAVLPRLLAIKWTRTSTREFTQERTLRTHPLDTPNHGHDVCTKTRFLKYFLPSHAEWNNEDHFHHLQQMPIGNKPTEMLPHIPEVCRGDWKNHNQYVTLFDSTRHIPVYALYHAEPYKLKDVTPPVGNPGHIERNQKEEKQENKKGSRSNYAWEEFEPQNGPTTADYGIDSDIDKGHLFPFQYASSPIQAKGEWDRDPEL